MDPKIRDQIALLRHQIISPVLMEGGRAQMAYFRSIEEREFDVPGHGPRKFRAVSMKGWLHRYKKQGFPGLVPRERRDKGSFRKMTPELREKIRCLRQGNRELSLGRFYDRCVRDGILGAKGHGLGIETLRRFLKAEGLLRRTQAAPSQPRKRFEMSRFGELWTADFMHGPEVLPNAASPRRKKAILMAIIDDYSRLIVGAEFGFQENTLLLERAFKSAILSFGCPDRLYVDNGASFSSAYLSRVCAHVGIGLVHSKPYDSPSRGKIERFFRTVREGFLATLHPHSQATLPQLNALFQTWLRAEYHHRHHGGIDARPIDRWQASLSLYPLKRIDEERLDEFFMVSVERTVTKDCTVSYAGVIYEVPPQYVGKRVEIRYVQDKPEVIYLYDQEIRVGRIQPVDTVANGRIYRPSARDPHLPFQNMSAPDPEVRS